MRHISLLCVGKLKEAYWPVSYTHLQVDGKVAVFQGIDPLPAAPAKAVDLRAGAAMVIAGLAARGCTEIEEIQYIERGYEDIVEKLQSLGADIRQVTIPDTVLRQAL